MVAPSNTTSRRGSALPAILVVIVLGVVGYFGWTAFVKYREKKDREQEEIRARNREINARNEEKRRVKPDDKPETDAVEKVVEDESKLEMPPEPPKKPEAEILREEEAHRKTVWAQIEEARKKGDAPLWDSFVGVKFGVPDQPFLSARPVKWGTAFEESAGDSVAARGVAFAVYGPNSIKSFGTKPLVWVTPQTRRPYRVEFSRPLVPNSATKHDSETTNLVARIQSNLSNYVEKVHSQFKVELFTPRPCVPGRAGCEFVFPMGTTTWTVGEYDGALRLSVEREDIRKEALAETEALRQRMSSVSADGELLDSRRYPNGGVDPKNYRGVRFRDGTPSSFCGIVFKSAPAENTTIQVPQKGAKGFFLDYRMAKCPPFRGFVYGRADIDSVRGGVYAIHLSSEGGVYGQDDKDYYETVKASLSAHYKVTPSEKKGEGEFPELTYQIGDLTVTFGSDPRGGFFLNAENGVLAALANTPPSATAKPRNR